MTRLNPFAGETSRRGAAAVVALLMLVALVVVGGYMWTRGSSGRSGSGTDAMAMSGEMAEGRALYEASCMECHGDGATGDGPLALSLPVPPANLLDHLGHHSEDELVRLISGGIPPAMPPTSLSDPEVRTVLAYLETLLPDGVTIGSMGPMPDMEMGGMNMGGDSTGTMQMTPPQGSGAMPEMPDSQGP